MLQSLTALALQDRSQQTKYGASIGELTVVYTKDLVCPTRLSRHGWLTIVPISSRSAPLTNYVPTFAAT